MLFIKGMKLPNFIRKYGAKHGIEFMPVSQWILNCARYYYNACMVKIHGYNDSAITFGTAVLRASRERFKETLSSMQFLDDAIKHFDFTKILDLDRLQFLRTLIYFMGIHLEGLCELTDAEKEIKKKNQQTKMGRVATYINKPTFLEADPSYAVNKILEGIGELKYKTCNAQHIVLMACSSSDGATVLGFRCGQRSTHHANIAHGTIICSKRGLGKLIYIASLYHMFHLGITYVYALSTGGVGLFGGVQTQLYMRCGFREFDASTESRVALGILIETPDVKTELLGIDRKLSDEVFTMPMWKLLTKSTLNKRCFTKLLLESGWSCAVDGEGIPFAPWKLDPWVRLAKTIRGYYGHPIFMDTSSEDYKLLCGLPLEDPLSDERLRLSYLVIEFEALHNYIPKVEVVRQVITRAQKRKLNLHNSDDSDDFAGPLKRQKTENTSE